ncbi:hypothetical protein [Streptomyces erythrochromogenes]|uniref:hypothetical protein n=1 Tax=Streptomyces erythrochromogenes TaxID=285574 RepID=UPI00224FEBD9|nr:hypothetical protein [Streptomyces erythrochromogenes]MCX5587563.1 hypothetical protein [Streptomyces erythrochromogenes]
MNRARAAADRLARGFAVVVPRRTAAVAAWVRAAEGIGGSLVRVGILLGAALLAWRAVRLWPALLWLAVPALCVAAWRTAPAPAAEADEEAPAVPPVEAIRALLWQLIGDAPGVHLSTVLAHLHKHGHHPTWKVADLRRHLERHGIPVELKLKLSGTPTRGVRREALGAPPPAADRAPSPTASTAV